MQVDPTRNMVAKTMTWPTADQRSTVDFENKFNSVDCQKAHIKGTKK